MLSNVFVFAGNIFLVDLLKKEWVGRFESKYGSEGIMRFDIEVEGDMEAFQTHLRTTSMFAEKRMLLVRGNPFGSGVKRSRGKASVAKASNVQPVSGLVDALRSAGDDTVVVFWSSDPAEGYPEEIPKRNIKALSAQGKVISGYDAQKDISYEAFFTHLFPDALGAHTINQAIAVFAKGMKKKEEPDLFSLYQALRQLSSLPRNAKSALPITDLLSVEDEEQGYTLVTLILAGGIADVCRILSSLAHQGMHPRQIFRMICTQTVFLLSLKAFIQDQPGVSAVRLSERFGKPTWMIQKNLLPLRSVSLESLRALVTNLMDFNAAMHTSDVNTERPDEFQSAFAQAISRFGLKTVAGARSRTISTARGQAPGLPAGLRA